MKSLLGVISASVLALSAQVAMADPIIDAVKSDNRSADAKARDEFRHPQQTLRFFGIEPDMTVVEISPGGGWYTDILADLLHDNGQLIAAHFYVDENSNDYYKKSRAAFEQKIADYPPYKNIKMSAFHPQHATDIAKAGSVDAVLTFRNVHNWYMGGGNEAIEASFKAFAKALKPGGMVGVVEHDLPESQADEQMEKSGYMKKSVVVAAAEAAGLTLAEDSPVNHNPADNAQHPRGVWTLPPSLRLGEQDQQKYLAIGESNRMTLKFIKPE